MSENIARRHLNPGQRNAGLEYEEFYAKAAKTAQRHHGGTAPGQPKETLPADLPEVSRPLTAGQRAALALEKGQENRHARESREKAAKVTGGSGRGVQQAKAVKRDAPDLYKKVIASEIRPVKGSKLERYAAGSTPGGGAGRRGAGMTVTLVHRWITGHPAQTRAAFASRNRSRSRYWRPFPSTGSNNWCRPTHAALGNRERSTKISRSKSNALSASTTVSVHRGEQ